MYGHELLVTTVRNGGWPHRFLITGDSLEPPTDGGDGPTSTFPRGLGLTHRQIDI